MNKQVLKECSHSYPVHFHACVYLLIASYNYKDGVAIKCIYVYPSNTITHINNIASYSTIYTFSNVYIAVLSYVNEIYIGSTPHYVLRPNNLSYIL